MINFKREHFVKDLLNPTSLIKDVDIVEFASFNDFAQVILRDKKLDLETVDKIIIPADCAADVSTIMKIAPGATPPIIIYLKNFTKEVRDAFCPSIQKFLMIDAYNIDELLKEMKTNISYNFLSFISKSYGYFRDEITYEKRNEIANIYSDSYFKFPYFCCADVRWDWASFNQCTMEDLKAVDYMVNVVRYNMMGRRSSISLKEFGDESKELNCVWDFKKISQTKKPQVIYVKEGCLYIDNDIDGAFSKFDLYANLDPYEVPVRQLDRMRQPYDAIFTNACGIKNRNLIRVSQNYKITKNTSMIPEITRIVDNLLSGGII